MEELDDMSPLQKEALDLIEELSDDAALHVQFLQKPGDILFLNNFLTLHRRSAFEDHQDPKLRTVIWDFAQEPISGHLMEQIASLLESLGASQGVAQELAPLLAPEELTALCQRLEGLLRSGRFPSYDPNRRNVPWPWF